MLPIKKTPHKKDINLAGFPGFKIDTLFFLSLSVGFIQIPWHLPWVNLMVDQSIQVRYKDISAVKFNS